MSKERRFRSSYHFSRRPLRELEVVVGVLEGSQLGPRLAVLVVDAGLEHAWVEVLADKDFQRLVGVQALGSRDSFADTAACDGRRDTAGILVDRVACGRMEQTELLVDLAADIRLDKDCRGAASEILANRQLGDEKP